MEKLPSIYVLSMELKDYYPNDMKKAISYLEIQYELDTLSAIQLAGAVWNSLHLDSPLNLPHFLVNPRSIFLN